MIWRRSRLSGLSSSGWLPRKVLRFDTSHCSFAKTKRADPLGGLPFVLPKQSIAGKNLPTLFLNHRRRRLTSRRRGLARRRLSLTSRRRGLAGRRGLALRLRLAAHVRQHLHLHAPIFLPPLRRIVRRHILVLADPDQVKPPRRNAVLRRQVLHHRVGAALAQLVVVLRRPRSNPSRRSPPECSSSPIPACRQSCPAAPCHRWSARTCQTRKSRKHSPPACSCPAPSPRCPASRRDAPRRWPPCPQRSPPAARSARSGWPGPPNPAPA